MRRWLALLAVLVGVMSAGAAAACEIIGPEIHPGETPEQAFLREERAYQAQLIDDSDAVFVATPRYDARRSKTQLTTVAPLLGRKAPKRVTAPGPSPSCGAEVPWGGRVVVFGGRIGIWDDFWRPWNWGRWVVIGWREEHRVVEPRLLARLEAQRV